MAAEPDVPGGWAQSMEQLLQNASCGKRILFPEKPDLAEITTPPTTF
jgi:hypothetical protein